MSTFYTQFLAVPYTQLVALYGVTLQYWAPGAIAGTNITGLFTEDNFNDPQYDDGSTLERHATFLIPYTTLAESVLDALHDYRFTKTDGTVTKSYGVKGQNRTRPLVDIQLVEIRDHIINAKNTRTEKG